MTPWNITVLFSRTVPNESPLKSLEDSIIDAAAAPEIPGFISCAHELSCVVGAIWHFVEPIQKNFLKTVTPYSIWADLCRLNMADDQADLDLLSIGKWTEETSHCTSDIICNDEWEIQDQKCSIGFTVKNLIDWFKENSQFFSLYLSFPTGVTMNAVSTHRKNTHTVKLFINNNHVYTPGLGQGAAGLGGAALTEVVLPPV